MYIIAGLGNPGRQYAHTRHNSGYEAIDRLAEKYGIRIETEKFKALTGSGMIEGQKVLLLKPLTYMNSSGESIRAACDFYKIDPEEGLVVLYDDISLPPGQLRVRAKGSAGGHNGIKSIIQHLGTQNFARVKIGVGEKPESGSSRSDSERAGRPAAERREGALPKRYDLVDYVLGHFSEEEWATMTEAFSRAGDAAAMLLTEDVQTVMNRYNAHPAK